LLVLQVPLDLTEAQELLVLLVLQVPLDLTEAQELQVTMEQLGLLVLMVPLELLASALLEPLDTMGQLEQLV
jgi:hypothetical protein